MAGKEDNDTNSNRGFASMSKRKQREIASKGGQASHGGSNRSGRGSNLSNEDMSQGGQNSHKNQ